MTLKEQASLWTFFGPSSIAPLRREVVRFLHEMLVYEDAQLKKVYLSKLSEHVTTPDRISTISHIFL